MISSVSEWTKGATAGGATVVTETEDAEEEDMMKGDVDVDEEDVIQQMRVMGCHTYSQ